MLGNWSFGDYFKVSINSSCFWEWGSDTIQIQKEAIETAWKLLTEVYGLSPDRLYVTYFEGDAKQGLQPDTEAKQLWLDIGVPEDHILPGNAKDNFWGKHHTTAAFQPELSDV
jgi:alanyl-tRNA synthetase